MCSSRYHSSSSYDSSKQLSYLATEADSCPSSFALIIMLSPPHRSRRQRTTRRTYVRTCVRYVCICKDGPIRRLCTTYYEGNGPAAGCRLLVLSVQMKQFPTGSRRPYFIGGTLGPPAAATSGKQSKSPEMLCFVYQVYLYSHAAYV